MTRTQTFGASIIGVLLCTFFISFSLTHAHEVGNAPHQQTAESQALEAQVANQGSVLKGNSSADTKLKAIKDRKQLMVELIKTDTEAFFRQLISDEERSRLPKAVQDQIEKKETLTGKIEVLHIDDFENPENSRFEYHLRVGDKRYDLYFAKNEPALISDSTVNVIAYSLDGTLAAFDGSAINVIVTANVQATGVQRLLIIPVATSTGATPTTTPAEIQDQIFQGAFQQYYNEQSDGQVSFTGTTTDWIVSPTQWWYPGLTVDTTEVKNYLIQHNIELSQYDRVAFFVAGRGGGVSLVGKSPQTFNGTTYTISESWIGGYKNPNPYNDSHLSGPEFLFAHELGHALGVWHANSWGCDIMNDLDTVGRLPGTLAPYDPGAPGCLHIEYGNTYDVMGIGMRGMHFNAFYKDLLGWLAASSKTYVTGTGTYTLAPIEATSTNAVKALFVSNPCFPSSPPFYLEYRKPIGFDSNLPSGGQGIHINQVIAGGPSPHLINANYTTTTNRPQNGNALSSPLMYEALQPGQSFSWPTWGLSIGSLSYGSNTATLTVTLNNVEQNCVSVSPSFLEYNPGETISVSWNIPSGVSGDWIGITPVNGSWIGGAEDVTWFLTGGVSNGTDTLVAPAVGKYQLASIRGGSVLARSASFTAAAATTTTNASAYEGGNTITVTWNNPAPKSADWIGITTPGGPWIGGSGMENINWFYTGGTVSGSKTLIAPSASSTYQVAYFHTSTSNPIARSSTFSVTITPPTLTTATSSYLGGDTITINWNNPGTMQSDDWIGIATQGGAWIGGAQNVTWFYVSGAHTGTSTLPAPNVSGTYEMLYRSSNGQVGSDLVRSAPFTVTAVPPTLTTATSSYLGGDTITINWNNPGTMQSDDWIGIASQGGAWIGGAQNVTWFYVSGAHSGTSTLVAPATAGIYEILYRSSNGQVGSDLVRSAPFTVTAGLLSTASSSYSGGNAIPVSWTFNGTTYANDWIGLVLNGGAWTDYTGDKSQMWFYTNAAHTGTSSAIIAPNGVTGTFQLVYFVNNGYSEVMRGGSINIAP
ncbi:MAG: hypothetical protein Q8R25_02560 [bacterium]|nr:hypothetical protein [bacterium]